MENEQLTKEELIILVNLLASANVQVKESQKAYELFLKLNRIIEGM